MLIHQRKLSKGEKIGLIFQLGRFTLTPKFMKNIPKIADQDFGAFQSTRPNITASSKEGSTHRTQFKWDLLNDFGSTFCRKCAFDT